MKTFGNKLHAMFGDLGWLTLSVAVAIVMSIAGFLQAQIALAAGSTPQTATAYCSQYAEHEQINACKDGLNGTDCQNYATGFAQSIVDICKQAAKDLADKKVTTSDIDNVNVVDTTSPTPSPSTSKSPSPSPPNSVELRNMLDQAKSLNQYIDLLHSSGQDGKIDTTKVDDGKKESYVNGAGKQQPIKELKAGTGNSPVILFFNGGGWHSNDLMGERVADGKDGAIKAGDLGYAMYDVSYRLGSSSIYYAFEDVMRGIKHMQDNAKKYGIDPNKMVIWGDSAGGSLTMRAAASGKSGAKVAVGWSAPTNGYTGLFHSFQSFAIGMDHSTCIPTDLAGFTNFADLLNGGDGKVAQYGQGLSSNQFDSLGIGYGEDGTFGAGGGFDSGKINPLSLLTEGMIAGKNALSFASNVESISDKIKGKTPTDAGQSLTGSTINLASKKFPECIDNFNALSPALFASPDTPPSFLADFEVDGVISPDQTTGMRDKLRQMGIKSDALMLPNDDQCGNEDQAASPAGSGGCHLGYYNKFVCPTLSFVNSIIMPEKILDCSAANPAASPAVTNSNSGSGGGSSGSSNGGAKGSSQNQTPTTQQPSGGCKQGPVPVGSTDMSYCVNQQKVNDCKSQLQGNALADQVCQGATGSSTTPQQSKQQLPIGTTNCSSLGPGWSQIPTTYDQSRPHVEQVSCQKFS